MLCHTPAHKTAGLPSVGGCRLKGMDGAHQSILPVLGIWVFAIRNTMHSTSQRFLKENWGTKLSRPLHLHLQVCSQPV